MSLSCLRRDYPGVPLMALTATANQKVVEDAIRVLSMTDAFLYRSSFNRPNLAYEVRKKDGKTIDVMAEYIASRRHESGVIYCLSRKDCETVCDKLQAKLREKNCGSVGVSFYHAELDPIDRKQRHHAWSTGKISVLCATIAFGMGEFLVRFACSLALRCVDRRIPSLRSKHNFLPHFYLCTNAYCPFTCAPIALPFFKSPPRHR
jgi:bloom syndrome protein